MKINYTENKSDKFNNFVFWMILILLGGMIFSLFLAEAAIIILLFTYIFKSVKDKKLYYFKTPLDKAFLAFIIARLLSIIFSNNISASVESLNREIFFYSSFFLFTYFLKKEDEKSIIILFKVLIIAAVFSSLYGTSKVLLGLEERASSSTSSYSTLGMFLTVVFSITIGLGKNDKFFPNRIVWFITLLIIITGILFTFNRTHWGIVALISLFMIIIRERTFIVVAVALAGFIIVFAPTLSERFYQLIYFHQHLSDRDIIWKGAYILMFDHPILGFGTRTFREIFPLLESLQDARISSWHSDYLQMYFESGIIGLGAFLWVTFSIYKNGIIVIKNKLSSDFNRDLLFAVLLGITSLYLTAFVGGFILDPILTLLFQFLVAVIGVIYVKALKQHKS